MHSQSPEADAVGLNPSPSYSVETRSLRILVLDWSSKQVQTILLPLSLTKLGSQAHSFDFPRWLLRSNLRSSCLPSKRSYPLSHVYNSPKTSNQEVSGIIIMLFLTGHFTSKETTLEINSQLFFFSFFSVKKKIKVKLEGLRLKLAWVTKTSRVCTRKVPFKLRLEGIGCSLPPQKGDLNEG